MFKNKKVLVTGGAGLAGLCLIKRLLPLGAKVRATIHEKEPAARDGRVEYVRADLTRKEDCAKAVAGVEYVFHLAQQIGAAVTMERDPLFLLTSNVIMNALMLESAYRAKVKKFLFLGSSTSYPSTGERPTREEEFLDGDPYEKYFIPGWMKRIGEIMCRMYAEKINPPMPIIVLRPTNIYGEHDKVDPDRAHVLPSLVRKVVERQNPLEVWGTGDDVRDFIYVDDLVDAIFLAMEKVDSYNPINIGAGKGYTVKELLRIILEEDGYTDAEIVFNPAKPTMIPIRKVDIAKAKEILGFTPKTDLREGVRKTIRWYRESYAFPRDISV